MPAADEMEVIWRDFFAYITECASSTANIEVALYALKSFHTLLAPMLPRGSSTLCADADVDVDTDAPIDSSEGEGSLHRSRAAPLAFGTAAQQLRARRLWAVALDKWLEIGRRVTGLAPGEPQPALPTQQFLVCLVELFGFIFALLRTALSAASNCTSAGHSQSALFESASAPAPAAGAPFGDAVATNSNSNGCGSTSSAPAPASGSPIAIGEGTLHQCVEVFYVCLLMPFPPNETGVYLLPSPSPPAIAAFESIAALLDPSAKKSDSAAKRTSSLMIDPSRYLTRTTENANTTPLQDAIFKIFQSICQVNLLSTYVSCTNSIDEYTVLYALLCLGSEIVDRAVRIS